MAEWRVSRPRLARARLRSGQTVTVMRPRNADPDLVERMTYGLERIRSGEWTGVAVIGVAKDLTSTAWTTTDYGDEPMLIVGCCDLLYRMMAMRWSRK